MSWWAAVAQAVDSAIGMYQRNTADRKAGKTAYAENYQGLMGRVEAAKAAGIHPLAAIGANIGSSGAPMPIGTDFRGIVQDFEANKMRKDEFNRDMSMRKQQQKAQAIQNAQEQQLREAQIKRMEKENSWIDEQIRASQEERVRASAQSMVSSASNPQDHAANNAGYFTVKPNEVTSHRNGVAQGTQPSVETLIDPATGRRIPVPFGYSQNSEPSELFSMAREISAHYGIPLDVITLKRPFSRLKNWLERASRGSYGPPANDEEFERALRRYRKP